MNFKQVRDTKVLKGTRTYELLESNKPEDQKTAKRLMEFARKAESCFYDLDTCRKLRKEFADVL